MKRIDNGYKLFFVFLLACSAQITSAQIKMEVVSNRFLFLDGRDSVCFYQKATKAENSNNLRQNYISLLFDLDGKRLTSASPAENPTRQGVFWAWPQIQIDGKQVSNGLDLQNFNVQMDNLEFLKLNDQGVLNVTALWRSPVWENGTKAYLKEYTKIVIYPRTGNYRRIDYDIRLKALTDGLSIGGYAGQTDGLGGFFAGLLISPEARFTGGGKMILPTEQAVEAENFVGVSGVGKQLENHAGLVVWSSPANLKKSQTWYLSLKQNFLNAVYPGANLCSIPFEEPLQLKYSLIIYKEDITVRQIQRAVR